MPQRNSSRAASRTPTVSDDPRDWLGSTRLIDANEPRIRIKSASLIQLARDERDKAVILHDFVRQMELRIRLRPAQVTARQILDARRGNAVERTTLMIAMLRAVSIPARLRYIEVGGNLLRGLVPYMSVAYRPLAEVWTGERWAKLDTHLFDPAYVAAARARLREAGHDFGYGIARRGPVLWNGHDDAYVGIVPGADGEVVREDLGVFADDEQFLASGAFRSRHTRMGREARWSVVAPFMNRVIAELRAQGASVLQAQPRART